MKPSHHAARISHPDYLSGPERAARSFTSASVAKSGGVAWFNARQKYSIGPATTALAQALAKAGVKR